MDSNSWGPMAAGGGMLGGGLGELFGGGWKNPADAASGSMNQIPDWLQRYLGPYINQGQSQYGNLNKQYQGLMNDPGGMVNQIGQSYHQSPGFGFAMQQALQGANHAAASGGMAGSPEHEQQNMGVATGIANQDYNNYLQNAMGMYGMGLQGSQGLYNTGADMSKSMGEDMASYFANLAKMKYEGQNAQNQHSGGMWGSIFGGAGSILGSMYGGPMGGAAGKDIGDMFGDDSFWD